MVNKGFTATFQRLSFELGMTGSWDNSEQGSGISGPAPRSDETVLPWGWNSPEQTWHSHCGQPTPLPPWILSLVQHLNLSGFLLPPHGTRGCCQHLQSHLLPDWASPSLSLSSWGSCSSNDHHAFDTLENGSFPGGQCILFCKEAGKVNYTDTLHNIIWLCVQGTTMLCPSLALLQAGLQLNQCLPIISCLCGSIPSILWKKWQQLQTSALLLSFLFFFPEQYIMPILKLSIHTNSRKTSALPLYCGLKSRWSAISLLNTFCVICQSKQCYSQLAKPWEINILQTNHILLLGTMGKF